MLNRYLLLIGFIVSSLVFISCSKNEVQSKSMEQIYKEEGVPVTIEVIEERQFAIESVFHSTLSGIKESNASAMVADKVDKIHYNVGDRVEKDAVVISFPTDNPGAKYNQTKVAYELAKTTLDRMTNLYNSGGISQQDYDNTKTQYKVTEANWNAVQQMVKVKAPISGLISQINVQETDNVNPGDALFTVTQTQKLKAKIWASENQISTIHKGDLVIAEWQGIEINGKVTQVDLSLNSSMQAFGVMVELNNPDNKFKSGINAEITIQSGEGSASIILERKDIIQEGDDSFVYINENGTARKRMITIGESLGLKIQVTSGLQIGDKLVTGGQMLLSDGTKIRVVQES